MEALLHENYQFNQINGILPERIQAPNSRDTVSVTLPSIYKTIMNGYLSSSDLSMTNINFSSVKTLTVTSPDDSVLE